MGLDSSLVLTLSAIDLEHNRLESLPQSIGGMLALSLLVLNEYATLWMCGTAPFLTANLP